MRSLMGRVGRMGRVGKREHHLSARQCGALGSNNADYCTTVQSPRQQQRRLTHDPLPILPITTQYYPSYPQTARPLIPVLAPVPIVSLVPLVPK